MALAQLLVEQNFPAIAIHRAMTQEDRYETFIFYLITCLLMIIFNTTTADYSTVLIYHNYSLADLLRKRILLPLLKYQNIETDFVIKLLALFNRNFKVSTFLPYNFKFYKLLEQL